MLLTIVFFFLICIEVFYISYFEKRIWGTYLTPFNFLAIPYIIILFFALLFANSLGFFSIYWASILVWNIGLFIFWLPSLLLGVVIFKRTGIIKTPFKELKANNISILLKITIIMSLLLVYAKIIHLSKLYGMGSVEYIKFFSVGLVAHLSLFLKLIFIYLIITVKKLRSFSMLVILLILFSLIINGSKSWLFIPIFTGIIIRNFINENNLKLNFKLLLLILLLIFFVFFVIYYFSVGKHLVISDYLFFLIKHISLYFMAGIISLSEYIKHSFEVDINPSMIFVTPINFYNKITGHNINLTYSDVWTVINTEGVKVNVKTFFGSMYMYAGFWKGIVFTFIFSLLHYFMFLLYNVTKNIFMLIIVFFWNVLLLFGWFELYYININFYEIPFWSIILSILVRLKIKNREIIAP